MKIIIIPYFLEVNMMLERERGKMKQALGGRSCGAA
jgi:hypothetical protein